MGGMYFRRHNEKLTPQSPPCPAVIPQKELNKKIDAVKALLLPPSDHLSLPEKVEMYFKSQLENQANLNTPSLEMDGEAFTTI